MASHFLDGANVVELPEPVDYLTHRVGTAIEYATGRRMMRLGYDGSVFENDTATLTWDSPLRLTDAVNAPSRGRLDLAPRNQSHAVSFVHGLTLPWRSRLTGTASYNWMLQDSSFLPFTINSALVNPTLPGKSLDGQLNVLALNYLYSARPIPDLGFDASYRLYDLDNRSRSLVFTDYVRADTALAGVSRGSLRYEFRTQNADIKAAYSLGRKATFKLAYDWENWHRSFREVKNSNEHGVGPTLEFRPCHWGLLRGVYRRCWRDPKRYRENASLLSFPDGVVLANPRQKLLRKFTESERERDSFSLFGRAQPWQRMTFAGSVELAQDDYDADYGVLNDLNLVYPIDSTIQALNWLPFYANYTREEYRSNQRSRFRPVALGAGVDDPTNDWTSRVRDKVDTWGVGTELALIPDRLSIDASYSFSLARSPNTTSSAAGGEVDGDGVSFPTVRNRLHQLSTTATYTLSEQVSLRVGYAFEKYSQSDFATDNLEPFMGAVDPQAGNSVFLAGTSPDYEAHIATFTMAYRF